MDKIIGLGGAGVAIADLFSQQPQYEVYKIDDNVIGPRCFSLGKLNSPEEYERNVPGFREFFFEMEGEVLFIMSASGNISGAALKILEQIKHCKLNILLIVPNLKSLNKNSFLQTKVTFNVLQQYARSGMLNHIYLVSNDMLENITGELPLLEYYDTLNKLIVTTIHSINYFNNNKALTASEQPLSELSRIATFGTLSPKTFEEKSFFMLQSLLDKRYYFAIDNSTLKTDGKLLKNIREHIGKGEVRPSYQIHQTEYSDSYCYFVSYSNVIQSLDT
jgi:hypothetical protein